MKESRPLRRSRAEMEAFRDALFSIVEERQPTNVRHVFYRAATAGLVEKTEGAYKTVVKQLSRMRLDGSLPFDWLADATRWVHRPDTYSGIEDAIEATARTYRRSLWADATERVEVWIEKEALAGVVVEVTDPWDVPLYVTRGYSSLSFLHSAAVEAKAVGKPTRIYYLGDHDPSGLDIARNVKERLREFGGERMDLDGTVTGVPIYFERLALTMAQIEEFKLPTRPTKKSDSRARNFRGESVELDAMDPREIRRLVEEAIEAHVDQDHLAVLRVAEESEREALRMLAIPTTKPKGRRRSRP